MTAADLITFPDDCEQCGAACPRFDAETRTYLCETCTDPHEARAVLESTIAEQRGDAARDETGWDR